MMWLKTSVCEIQCARCRYNIFMGATQLQTNLSFWPGINNMKYVHVAVFILKIKFWYLINAVYSRKLYSMGRYRTCMVHGECHQYYLRLKSFTLPFIIG